MGAKEQFREASALFEEGRYEDALILLKDLDALYPGDHHILYPMALSLAKIGHWREGLQICERLEDEFGYAKAAELGRKLRKILTPPPLPGSAKAAAAATASPDNPAPEPEAAEALAPLAFDSDSEASDFSGDLAPTPAGRALVASDEENEQELPLLDVIEEDGEMAILEEAEDEYEGLLDD